jgi:hypothetical protein
VSELHEALEREDAQRVQPVRVQALADVLRIKLSEHVEHSQHLRYKLRTHVLVQHGQCDGDAMHCGAHGIGGDCPTQQHRLSCSACKLYIALPSLFKLYANAVANDLKRLGESLPAVSAERQHILADAAEVSSMLSVIRYLSRTFYLFQQHVVRGYWQGQKIKDMFNSLTTSEVAIIVDHKQKVLPQSFRESSVEHYGKAGMSLLGAAVRFRLSNDNGAAVQTCFYDVVCEDNKQDTEQVQAIISCLVKVITQDFPGVQTIKLVSDNGTAFSSGENMQYIWSMNKINWGIDSNNRAIRVSDWFFYEAQCGKTILDTHFSFVGIILNRYARSGSAVSNTLDIYNALAMDNGIANSSALLIGITRPPPAREAVTAFKLNGIQKIHEIRFVEAGIETLDQTGARAVDRHKFTTTVAPMAYEIKQNFRSPNRRTEGAQEVVLNDGTIKRTVKGELTSTAALIEAAVRGYVQGANAPKIDINQFTVVAVLSQAEFEADVTALASMDAKRRGTQHVNRTRLAAFLPDYGFHWTDKLVRSRPALPPSCDTKLKAM